ncbi:hypothetical protein DL93DRAFT_2203778 [Clavulina sp. PMI_390]|nr:hypothetical protein DL93DRAFT_2203778 [Clavulina sp. PMI_390]
MYLNPFSSRSSAKINASHKELDSLPTNIPIADDEIEEGHQEVLVEPQAPKQKLSKSNKKKKGADAAPVVSPTAVTIQNLLSGDVATTTTSLGKPSSRTKALTTAQTRIAPELLHEDKANKVISEVRQLSPLSPLQERKATPATPQSALAATPSAKQPPAVHAVCLDATDEEVAEKVFTHLNIIPFLHVDPAKALSTLTSLVTVSPVSPQILPPNAPVTLPDAGELAMLAGAVPSPQTIVDGVNDVATTLIALGLGDPEALYATSGTPPDLSKWLPDHKGVYPPKDRMSILTCEWGYELVLPEPSMKNLARAKSIEGMVLNFLTFFAMLNGGVREILPFVRYIAQFIDIEWSSMTAKDRGKGVICAATWLLPTSIVTRSWDFPEPPPPPPPPASSPAHDQNQSPSSAPLLNSDPSKTVPANQDPTPTSFSPTPSSLAATAASGVGEQSGTGGIAGSTPSQQQ